MIFTHDYNKALYGPKCRTPMCYNEVGPELFKSQLKRLKLSRHNHVKKSYADRLGRPLEFQAGDMCLLMFLLFGGTRYFGVKTKLNPRYIRFFEILERIGEVAYHLVLPSQLSHVHNVFHVSTLRGYQHHPLHIIDHQLDKIGQDLSYVEEPEAIIGREERKMCHRTLPFVKVLQLNRFESEAT
ncbi:hypothetical protein OSB04_012522 [Centaurea solstitialis]|uniref:Tf2-1-like SH3-like domain-containing protein n=1 Tax=Centaurea solstitialis TaxID=347529 RepID=A0AA38TBJ8_9ASTR|nr:hypothetical protein OSB04_012522 [Centaurea solstitialis]